MLLSSPACDNNFNIVHIEVFVPYVAANDWATCASKLDKVLAGFGNANCFDGALGADIIAPTTTDAERN